MGCKCSKDGEHVVLLDSHLNNKTTTSYHHNASGDSSSKNKKKSSSPSPADIIDLQHKELLLPDPPDFDNGVAPKFRNCTDCFTSKSNSHHNNNDGDTVAIVDENRDDEDDDSNSYYDDKHDNPAVFYQGENVSLLPDASFDSKKRINGKKRRTKKQRQKKKRYSKLKCLDDVAPEDDDISYCDDDTGAHENKDDDREALLLSTSTYETESSFSDYSDDVEIKQQQKEKNNKKQLVFQAEKKPSSLTLPMYPSVQRKIGYPVERSTYLSVQRLIGYNTSVLVSLSNNDEEVAAGQKVIAAAADSSIEKTLTEAVSADSCNDEIMKRYSIELTESQARMKARINSYENLCNELETIRLGISEFIHNEESSAMASNDNMDNSATRTHKYLLHASAAANQQMKEATYASVQRVLGYPISQAMYPSVEKMIGYPAVAVVLHQQNKSLLPEDSTQLNNTDSKSGSSSIQKPRQVKRMVNWWSSQLKEIESKLQQEESLKTESAGNKVKSFDFDQKEANCQNVSHIKNNSNSSSMIHEQTTTMSTAGRLLNMCSFGLSSHHNKSSCITTMEDTKKEEIKRKRKAELSLLYEKIEKNIQILDFKTECIRFELEESQRKTTHEQLQQECEMETLVARLDSKRQRTDEALAIVAREDLHPISLYKKYVKLSRSGGGSSSTVSQYVLQMEALACKSIHHQSIQGKYQLKHKLDHDDIVKCMKCQVAKLQSEPGRIEAQLMNDIMVMVEATNSIKEQYENKLKEQEQQRQKIERQIWRSATNIRDGDDDDDEVYIGLLSEVE